MMKRKILIYTAVLMFCLSGCSNGKKAGESTTDKVDEFASEAQQTMEGVDLPSESVTKAVSNTWIVPDTKEVYVLEPDGTGNIDGVPFTFECGFDDEKNITLEIRTDGSDESRLYAISTDSTGYGIDLASLDGGKDLKFLPENLEFLSVDDARVQGLIGTWTDESGNEYTFEEDEKLRIRSESSGNETKGTFSVVADSKDGLFFRIVVEGGSLEYGYELSDDGKTMKLASPGTDVVHNWTKNNTDE